MNLFSNMTMQTARPTTTKIKIRAVRQANDLLCKNAERMLIGRRYLATIETVALNVRLCTRFEFIADDTSANIGMSPYPVATALGTVLRRAELSSRRHA